MNKSLKDQILVANGVNLDLLGKREADIYGALSLKDLEKKLAAYNKKISSLYKTSFELCFFQTNCESDLLAKITAYHWKAMILNPGAWTHTSLALADRLAALDFPFIEVHLSNLSSREPIRQSSLSAKHARGVIYGLGFESYMAALAALYNQL